MSNIQPFDFEGTPVRTITYETGVTWWVLKDVCDALALSNPTMIAGRLEEDERAKSDLGRQGEAWIINESGLYNVILRSDKPEARRFRKWVTHTVLPQIRRTGGYIPMTEADDEKTILAKAMIISQRTMEMQKLTIQQQKTRLDVVEPKAQALDDLTSTEHLYTLTEAAQLLNNGGDGFGLKRLTNWLRTNKWIRRENKGNAPYQDKIDSGLLTTKAYKARFNPENGDYQTFTPKILVTAKGVARLYKQIYGISRASIEKAA
ncbi:phage antirepressor KilAC domain-containing protein [Bifidobacterium crudilactis]|nr:phage antirepressor KilAC domain-containing protein [Bifidobacterium crudilactis]MDN5973452.1 phage antirepressor KilAC domain-containing protein [Bifidobacterium crudilactis]MDN6210148.1 phage antirepressor KilAC domain-containing protein [Bifidobacterium crudilactis]MDN6468232.1 phage antirepressor KilAC domain-containing protein [Bifidobacterium crudilactis]MDN6559300.1 phage antirepressor KilAC domain-containing protein [Bifidobacterium crudilactis]MDN6585753.1 phage antirepressor KilAC